jgi:TonB-linked SusC/RagA family outer membrane protein
LKNTTPVDIEVKDATLEQALAIACKDQPLEFSITGEMVVIRVKTDKPGSDPPEKVDVKGRVVNEKGEPVPGVSVTIKDSRIGTITDEDGRFELANTDESAILVFSGANIEMQEEPLNQRKDLVVVVKLKIGRLDDVQIIGYGSVSRKLNTGNVSSISSETIQNQPVSNVLGALEGRIPGLIINQNSGVPGSGYSLALRGLNSISSGNNPLFVIDGIPFGSQSLSSIYTNSVIAGGNPFSNINPSDIESIDILKDADATAIYGSRGANGVVLITTKKGRAGKTRFDANAYAGASRVSRMIKLLNTHEYIEMRNEAFKNDGATPDSAQDYDLLLWDTTRNTDWQKDLIGGTSSTTDLQSSLSGGNANTQFTIDAGFHQEGTVFKGSFDNQKASVHVALNNTSANSRFTIGIKIGYVSNILRLPLQDFTNTALTLPPDAPAVYTTDGKLNWPEGFQNPYGSLSQKYKTHTGNLIGNTVLTYKILKGLEVKTSLGYTKMQMDEIQPSPLSSMNPSFGSTSGNTFFSNSSIDTWIVEPQLEYKTSLLKGKLEALLGTTFEADTKEAQTLYAYGFSSDALLEDISAATTILVFNKSASDYRYNAFFGRINYSWDQKYLFNFTGRRDGSSRFGPGRQFANFGAVGIGWVFSKEPFFEKLRPIVSFGKIRGSYGITGNDQIGDYQYLNTYSSSPYPYQGVSGLLPTSLFNAKYGWETNRKSEIGLELGILDDRDFLSVSFFLNRSSDQLVGYPLPLITGFSSIQGNFPAIVENRGLEISISTTNAKSEKFSWSSYLTLTVPQNKLVSFPNIAAFPGYANRFLVGKSLNSFKGLKFGGVNAGSGVYQFFNANDKITPVPVYPDDYQNTKDLDPVFFGGFGNVFQIGNFKMDLFIQVVKQLGLTYFASDYVVPGMIGNQPELVLNRWNMPGMQPNMQKFTQTFGDAGQAYFNYLSSNGIIGDGSFIRLKNLSLSYKLPSKMLQRYKITDLTLFVQGQNLLTLTSYKGVDPENQSIYSLPPLKTLAVGFHISF